MKWKWHQSYRTTIQKHFVISFPEFVAHKYRTSLYNSIGFDLKGPGQIEWIGRIWPLRLPIAALITFLGSLNSGVINPESFSGFKYGFDTAKHDKCLEKKDI